LDRSTLSLRNMRANHPPLPLYKLREPPEGACSTLPFVTRRRRCGQMRGRRPGKTGGVFAGIRWGFFRAEHDADGRGSLAAV